MKTKNTRLPARFPASLSMAAFVILWCLSTFGAAPVSISQGALDQIGALLAEKDSWTPVQTKMDSELIHAVKNHRGQVFAAGVTNLELNVEVQADGRVLVDITANVNPDLLELIKKGGGEVINSFPQFRAIRALVTPDQLEALAGSQDVAFIRRAVPAETNIGSVDSQGDVTHMAGAARTGFGATGAGIKVGVLSDSVDYLDNSQVLGDLGPVTVLSGQSGVPRTGEGTAMLEIIHDLTPDAQLYFATAVNGEASFAQNILNLYSSGCNIIIDDVGYFDESPFQDGIIAQAVNTVTAGGALYFSSAHNSGNLDAGSSGTWEGDFADGGAVTFPETGRVHSFGSYTYNTVTSGGSSRHVDLFWSDPLGAATNDYDVFVLDGAGSTVLRSSTTRQNGFQDPYEYIGTLNVGERIVIVKYSGAARFLHLGTGRGRLSVATSGAAIGHSTATNAFSVAAVNVATAFPNPFTGGASNPVETFSSDGPRQVFYHADGTAITPGNFLSTGGSIRQKPDIAAADGVVTTLPAGGLNPFFGTSAAAPHAGAIAALIWSYNPSLTPSQMRTILTSTALDIGPAGIDRDSGAGIVMAYPALTNLAGVAPLAINLQPSDQTVFSGATVAFSVTAIGTPPFTYFWRRNSTPITGANAPTYSTNNVQLSDSGSQFCCLVSNALESILSSNATLTVIAHPVNDQCSNATFVSTPYYTNAQSTITATSTGDPVPGCITGFGNGVWYNYTPSEDGLLVVDTIGSSFDTGLGVYSGMCGSLTLLACDDDSAGPSQSSITNVVIAGTTYFILAGGHGAASGNLVFHLAFTSTAGAPFVLSQPASQLVAVGSNATFTITAAGSAPLKYFWKCNGMDITGASAASYTASNVQLADSESQFNCVVTNAFGVVTSSAAKLTAIPPFLWANPMNAARQQHTATLLPNGKVLVAGGYYWDRTDYYLSSAELYDPATGTWTPTGSLQTGRYTHTATLLPNGKVLVAGGYGMTYLSSAELYDPVTGTWATTDSMPTTREIHTATLLPNGRVLVAGGYGFNFYLRSADLYDPATGQWTTTGAMANSRCGHTATLLGNGKVLVVGGGNLGIDPLASAELYDPATGMWTATGSLQTGRMIHAATLLSNGKIIVTGGRDWFSGVFSSVELYDPGSGLWSLTGPLNTGRHAHTATLLSNGNVLVAGGDKGPSFPSNPSLLSTAELYDPVSARWTIAALMTAARDYHTATLLTNGKVLVAGGSGTNGILSSSELYDAQPPATSNCTLAPSGIVAWWPGDGSTQDIIGTNNGALMNGATYSTGKVVQAFYFDGTNDYVSLNGGTTNLPLGKTPRTVEAWVRTTMIGLGEIFSYGAGSSGQAFSFGVWGASLFVSGWSSPQYSVNANVNDGAFHHVAVAYDGTNASVYFDGTLLDTRAFVISTGSGTANIGARILPTEYFSGTIDELSVYNRALTSNEISAIYLAGSAGKCKCNPPFITQQPASLVLSTGQLANFSVVAIGNPPFSYQWCKGGTELFDGGKIFGAQTSTLTVSNVSLADAGFYSAVVTNAFGSVTSLLANLSVINPIIPDCVQCPPGIIAWWPGEGNAQDVIGTNSGTLMNGTAYFAGKVGEAFSFDGVDDYMSAPQTALSNILNNFTMEFWVYPTASRVTTTEVNGGISGSHDQRYAVFPYYGREYSPSDSTLDTGVGVSVGTNGISVYEHGANYIPSLLVYQGTITGWTHVAVVYTNKQPILYVNGVWARTGLVSTRPWVHPSSILGGNNWFGQNYGCYAGLLDEVSIYSRALTSDEIASIFAAGSSGKCLFVPPLVRNLVIGWPTNGLGMTNLPANLTNAVRIAAGVYHSLALKADGTVVGWGENDFGQTEPPAGLTNVTAIAAGWGTSLALKRDGTLTEWGWDGGYGLKSTAESLTNITAISACWDCLMALKSDGTVLVWGKSTHGETNLPSGLIGVTAIAGGGFHCLALKSDGTVTAWGDNSEGQLNVPTGLAGVVGIAAGGYHSLALRQDGTVVVWGKNSAGQTNVPQNLAEVVAISGGYYHSLALKSDGSIAAWGDNSNGQTNVPTNLTNVVAIAAGGYHNLALTGSRAPWTRFKNMSCATNGQVRFTVSGLCGDVYQILGSTNLQHWQVLGTITNVNGAVDFIDPSATNYTQRFYRILMP